MIAPKSLSPNESDPLEARRFSNLFQGLAGEDQTPLGRGSKRDSKWGWKTSLKIGASWFYYVGLTCIAVTYFAGAGLAQVVDDDRLADLLGLEPSEFGRLLSANPLPISDSNLQVALSQLGDRPFRLLPQVRPEFLPQRQLARVSRVLGTVVHIVRHSILDPTTNLDRPSPEPLASRDDSNSIFIYECLVQPLGSSLRPVRVLTRNVPQLWSHLPWQKTVAGQMEWRPSGSGLTLHASALLFELGEKRLLIAGDGGNALEQEAEPTAAEPYPTGVTKRIEWPERHVDSLLQLLEHAESHKSNNHSDNRSGSDSGAPTVDQPPDSKSARQRTAAAWALLGTAGFDLGLWDSVADGQRRPLLPSDNEPFYQLLAANSKMASPKGSELPLQDLIRHPQRLVGQSFQIHATIKQVTRVPSDPDDRATQLGINEYYLLHGVFQLPRPLRLKFDGGREIQYQQHFPLVIATTTLPEGLAVGDQVRQWVRGDGLLFKLWSYQSLRSQEAQVDQWAPLLVSNNLNLSGPPADTTETWPISGLLLIPIGLGLLFLLIFGLRGLSRRS